MGEWNIVSFWSLKTDNAPGERNSKLKSQRGLLLYWGTGLFKLRHEEEIIPGRRNSSFQALKQGKDHLVSRNRENPGDRGARSPAILILL